MALLPAPLRRTARDLALPGSMKLPVQDAVTDFVLGVGSIAGFAAKGALVVAKRMSATGLAGVGRRLQDAGKNGQSVQPSASKFGLD